MELGQEQDLVMKPGQEEEPEEELEKDPESLSVESPMEPVRWLKPEMQKALEPKGKPELELDLVLMGKDWPELKLAPGQVSMWEPQLSSTLEHGKKWEPTKEGDQVSEVGTGPELWPNPESRLTLTGKDQLMPKEEVQKLLR
jgi:hypothetical protein